MKTWNKMAPLLIRFSSGNSPHLTRMRSKINTLLGAVLFRWSIVTLSLVLFWTDGSRAALPLLHEKYRIVDPDLRRIHETDFGQAVAIDGNTLLVGAPRDASKG